MVLYRKISPSPNPCASATHAFIPTLPPAPSQLLGWLGADMYLTHLGVFSMPSTVPGIYSFLLYVFKMNQTPNCRLKAGVEQ